MLRTETSLAKTLEQHRMLPSVDLQGLSDYRVVAVIPALNEAENLPHVLSRMPAWVDEVLLVDGNSTDGTPEIASQLDPRVRVLMQEGRGKGAALRTGVTAAAEAADIIIMLDADGSTDPNEIPAFVGTLLSGADFAKGSRFIQGAGTDDMPLYRRLGNWAFVALTNILFRSRFSDITYGYNAVWSRHVQALALELDGWEHEIVSNIRVHRSGLRVVEVASFERPRLAGVAKLGTLSAGWAILKAILRERLRPAATTNLSRLMGIYTGSAGTGQQDDPRKVKDSRA